jgi:hypothetical protein
MNKPTWKPNGETTFHRDGTVSYYDCRVQRWLRGVPSDAALATFSHAEVARVVRHCRLA